MGALSQNYDITQSTYVKYKIIHHIYPLAGMEHELGECSEDK